MAVREIEDCACADFRACRGKVHIHRRQYPINMLLLNDNSAVPTSIAQLGRETQPAFNCVFFTQHLPENGGPSL
jgi:hypothetical protein